MVKAQLSPHPQINKIPYFCSSLLSRSRGERDLCIYCQASLQKWDQDKSPARHFGYISARQLRKCQDQLSIPEASWHNPDISLVLNNLSSKIKSPIPTCLPGTEPGACWLLSWAWELSGPAQATMDWQGATDHLTSPNACQTPGFTSVPRCRFVYWR